MNTLYTDNQLLSLTLLCIKQKTVVLSRITATILKYSMKVLNFIFKLSIRPFFFLLVSKSTVFLTKNMYDNISALFLVS